jgi:SseB protein N-terminal domain
MSIATGSNSAMPASASASRESGGPAGAPLAGAMAAPAADGAASVAASAYDAAPGAAELAHLGGTRAGAVERALAAAVQDAGRIGDLLDVLRSARLWLPLPDDGSPVVRGTAVTLPTVSYLGSDFVPAYSSPELLAQLTEPRRHVSPADPEPASRAETGGEPPPGPSADAGIAILPHVVVRAADLARLLPPDIGIALNAGASESVPVYPKGVSYLAADADEECDRIRVGPLPVRPDGLLASIAAELLRIPAVSGASAAWLSVQFAGEGLLIAVTLDNPDDPESRDVVIAAVERAAWQASAQDAAFPIDVIFPGESEPDEFDSQVADVGTAFYRR